jgi:hypothetical protein
MWTNDRYQPVVYLGTIGPIWTLGIVTDSPVIVSGPYCVCAADVFVAGAQAADTFHAGAVAAQGDCC